MNLGRRGLLKLISAAPAVAAAAPALATQAAGFVVPGLAAGALHGGAQPMPCSTNGARVFSTFLSYMKDREAVWRREAKHVQAIDPDIATMRLPLVTKCRMQSERNYDRIKGDEKSWFEERFARDGKVEVW